MTSKDPLSPTSRATFSTPSEFGFSLLELLLVLLVSGVIFSSATLALRPLRSSPLKREAEYLAQCLRGLSLRAEQSAQDIELVLTATGFEAHPAESKFPVFLRHKFSSAVQSELAPGEKTKQVVLHPTGTASPATIVLRTSNNSCPLTISLRGRVQVSC